MLWSAALSRPDPVARGAGEGAFGMAEQLGFEQGLGGRAEVDRDQRLAAPARQAMDFAGDDFLAGAILAEDQDIGVGRRRALDQRPDALHRFGLAEQRRLAAVRQLGRAAALDARVDLAAAQRGGAADGRRQPLVAPRLGDEIAGARA